MTTTHEAARPTIINQLRDRQSYLSGTEVMALLGISRNALCRWVRSGLIPAIRIGKDNRFDPACLSAWLEARQV